MFGLVAFPFFLFIEKSFHVLQSQVEHNKIYPYGVYMCVHMSIFTYLHTPVHAFMCIMIVNNKSFSNVIFCWSADTNGFTPTKVPMTTKLIAQCEITDLKTLEIVSGKSLSYRWKGFGLKLEAPSNALDCGVPSQTLNLLNCNIDQFKVPENMELVSGIYLVDFKGKFAHPITIEIEYCASVNQPSQFSSLSFVSMKPPIQEATTYQLHPFSGGVFPQDSCYGSIQLGQSSFIAVVTAGSVTKSYRALNYYIPKTTTTWHMDLIVIYDLEISIEVCLLSSTLK